MTRGVGRRHHMAVVDASGPAAVEVSRTGAEVPELPLSLLLEPASLLLEPAPEALFHAAGEAVLVGLGVLGHLAPRAD